MLLVYKYYETREVYFLQVEGMDDLKEELKRLRKAKDDIQAEMVVALKVNSIFFCIFMTF